MRQIELLYTTMLHFFDYISKYIWICENNVTTEGKSIIQAQHERHVNATF